MLSAFGVEHEVSKAFALPVNASKMEAKGFDYARKGRGHAPRVGQKRKAAFSTGAARGMQKAKLKPLDPNGPQPYVRYF
jgi:hypothetical protein